MSKIRFSRCNNLKNSRDEAMLHLITRTFEVGEPVAVTYKVNDSEVDTIVAIGIKNGAGTDCFSVLSAGQYKVVWDVIEGGNLISIDRLVHGQTYLYHDIDRKVSSTSILWYEVYAEGAAGRQVRVMKPVSKTPKIYQSLWDNFLWVSDLEANVSRLGGGSGGSAVSILPIQTEGVKIAEISINGVVTGIFAPTGGEGVTAVNIIPSVVSGEKLASIYVDDKQTDIYAPEQLQPDWEQVDDLSKDYIKNKPELYVKSITSDGVLTDSNNNQWQLTKVKAVTSITYDTPIVTLSYPDISAAGSTVAPSCSYRQTKRYHWNDGTETTEQITTGGTKVFSITGTEATINENTGRVTAGATTRSSRYSLGTVTLKVTLNEKVGTATCTVYQTAATGITMPTFYTEVMYPSSVTITDGTGYSSKLYDSEGNEIPEKVAAVIGSYKAVYHLTGAGTVWTNGTSADLEDEFSIVKSTITLTAPSDSKVYDGTALSKSTYTKSGVGTFASGEEPTITVSGSITNVGSVTNKITCTFASEDIAAKYEMTIQDGELSITKRNVTLTADSSTKTYDGTELSKNSYKVTSGSIVESDKTYFNYSVSGSITNAGTVSNVLSGDISSTTIKGNYSVTTQNGTLTVSKRSVTLKADSASKVYDGTALTKNTYTVTSGSIVEADKTYFSYSTSGSQTNAGSSSNVLRGDITDTTIKGNYTVSTQNGTLTVTKASNTISWITAPSSSAKIGDTIQCSATSDHGTIKYYLGSTEITPGTSTYTSIGTFTVKAVATDSSGNYESAEISSNVTVGAIPYEYAFVSTEKISDIVTAAGGWDNITNEILANNGVTFTSITATKKNVTTTNDWTITRYPNSKTMHVYEAGTTNEFDIMGTSALSSSQTGKVYSIGSGTAVDFIIS